MLRLLTVTLNPALDQVYEVPGFTVGELNRPASKTTTAGGKGINVARAYRSLGGHAVATGFAGGHAGRDIVDASEAEGISTAFVTVAAESRTCVKIADSSTGSQTEVNEPGPRVTRDEYSALLARVRELLPDVDVVVLSGSVPPGVPDDVYATLTRIAQDEFGVDTLLDASGSPLRKGIEAGPKILKPNRAEARELGISPEDWRESVSELRERYQLGTVLVTAGADGAAIESESGRWYAASPKIVLRSAVGSGDSLTAGFLSGWSNRDAVEALRRGIAAGAVNAESYRSGDISTEAVREMAGRVTVSAF